jgi:hypothetical protein
LCGNGWLEGLYSGLVAMRVSTRLASTCYMAFTFWILIDLRIRGKMMILVDLQEVKRKAGFKSDIVRTVGPFVVEERKGSTDQNRSTCTI